MLLNFGYTFSHSEFYRNKYILYINRHPTTNIGNVIIYIPILLELNYYNTTVRKQ